MTGALYSAVSGLRAHMSKLNVIGNNIANVNTYSYKTTRMTFTESISTTARAGVDSAGQTSGGLNPTQYGYGSVVSTVDVNMASATYSPTGYALDCMIGGDGFFLLGDKTGSFSSVSDISSLMLSRMGDFRPDSDGYITDANGNIVYGFAMVQNPNYNPNATDLELLADPTIGDPEILSTDLVPLKYPTAAATPTLENGGIVYYYLSEDGEEIFYSNDEDVDDPAAWVLDAKENGFDLVEVKNWEEGTAVYDYLSTPDVLNGNAAYNTGTAQYWEDTNGDGVADDDEIVNSVATVAAFNNGESMYGQTQIVSNSDGYQVQLSSVSISAAGMISGINSVTGETVVVGYIAIGTVDNTSGVTNTGGSYYAAMGGSGNLRVSIAGGVAEGLYIANKTATVDEDGNVSYEGIGALDAIGSAGGASINSCGLEASSVDLATEMSEMITTQRGYQANTRIVTVTDSMLEELVNMKR